MSTKREKLKEAERHIREAKSILFDVHEDELALELSEPYNNIKTKADNTHSDW